VDNASLVSSGHTPQCLDEDWQSDVRRNRSTAVHHSAQGLPLDEFHHRHGHVVPDEEIEQGGDVGMIQSGLDTRLLAEPFDEFGIIAERCAQYLDGYCAIEVHVEGAVNDAHAALADDLVQTVLIE